MVYRNFYRKGEAKAAIEAEFIAAKQRLEAENPKVEARDVRELTEKLLERALRVLEQDLTDGEPRVRSEAARAIGAIGVNLLKNERDQPEPVMTADERAARLASAEASPEVRAYLVSRGWKEPGNDG